MKFTNILLLLILFLSAGTFSQEKMIPVSKKIQENPEYIQPPEENDVKSTIGYLISQTKDNKLKDALRLLIQDDKPGENKPGSIRIIKNETLLEDNYLLSEEIYQTWNGASWDNNYRYLYLYDSRNNQVQATSQQWSVSIWVNYQRASTTYDSRDNPVENLYQSWNSTTTSWENQSKYTYTYNTANLITEMVSQTWNGTAWVNNYRYLETYDANNNLIEELSQNWNGTVWVNESRLTAVYDINNNMLERIYQSWDGSAWVNSSKYLYTYDSNNKRTLYLYQTWNSTAWVNVSRTTYTYDVYKNLIEYITQVWNSTLWVNESRATRSYDVRNNLLEQVYQNWDTLNVWKNTVRYLYAYNSNDRIITYTSQQWNISVWENDYKTSITYNSNDDPTEYLQQTWNVSVWENDYRSTYTYDSNNNRIKVVNQDWNGTLWVNQSQYLTSWVLATTINLISPNGGEIWEAGTQQNITWSSTNISSVKLQYSTNNGTAWINIGNVTASLGSFAWTVPATLSTNCLVQISDVSNPAVYDKSDTVFTISEAVNPEITVIAPNGGENIISGTNYTIRWMSNDVTNVKIEYTTDNGTTWNIVIASTSSDSSHEWTVPSTLSVNCKVKISDVTNASITDQSDAVFTISATANPVITLTAPNGGEVWISGTTHSVTWTSNDVDSVKIEYTTNAGTNWNVIAASVPSNGTYSWIIPNASAVCKIKISDVSEPTVMDTSNNVFVIFSYPSTINVAATFNFGDATKTTSYQIIGIPGANNIALSSVMTGSPGATQSWRAFWDPGTGNYTEYDGSNIFNFTPGKAFWVISKNAINFNQSVNSVSLETDFTYMIPLHNEWNLISNPFEKNIPWSTIQAANTVNQPIHFFQNGSYSNPANFEPYKGYYFYNNGLTALKIPYMTLAKTNLIEGKELDIILYTENIRLAEISAGIFKDAGSGADIYDIFSPPSQFCDVNLYFRNNLLETEYKLLQKDYRSEIGEGQEYNFSVKNFSEGAVLMKVKGQEDFNDYEIVLYDNNKKKFFDLKEQNSLTIYPAASEKEYSLFIGTSKYIASRKSELLPAEYMLFQNYPNPFNPSTKIIFALPDQSTVSLRIFNILGETVAELINNQVYEAGYHEMNFDGSSLSSGIYIYELQSRSAGSQAFIQTKKMILLK